MDLNDLEMYANFKHGKEFLKIPSSVIGKKPVIEWFSVDDISYWWFIAPMIHAKFKSATMFLDQLDSVVSTHNIDKIILKGYFEKADLIKNFCKVNNIELTVSSKFNLIKLNQFIKNIVKEIGYKKINQKKSKKRMDCVKSKNFSKPLLNSTLFTSPGIYRRFSYDLESGSAKKEEFYIQPFLDLLNQHNSSFTCFDLDYTFRGTTDILKERLETKFNWLPIEIILQGKKEDSTKRVISILKNQFKDFTKLNMDSLFNYKGIPLWNFLKPTFFEIFYEPNLPTYVDLIHKLEIFLNEVKPKQIIQVYESGPFAKAFEIAALKLKIKTFGIQHGLIPSDTPDYIFKEIKNNSYPFGNIVPDLTFVFGDYYKQILTEVGSYPKEKVCSIGHPSYFDIDSIKQNLFRSDLLKKYNLPDKKIILIPLSFNFSNFKNSPDHTFLNYIFQQFKDDREIIVLIRPHPGDNLSQTLFEKKYNSKNFIISSNTLTEDFVLCDIVVALPISTIITEAVLFEKPIILGNLGTKKQNPDFDKIYHELITHNVAFLCNLDEISKKINLINKGELWNMKNSQNRKKFLKLFFNYNEKIDLGSYLY